MKKTKKLGKYEIRRELGRGAMGVVYEAFDPIIERVVAIKAIQKSSMDKYEAQEIFNRFRREARAVGRLSHPGIVSIYEYGEDDEVAFIVMELIHGRELKEYFEAGERFTIREGALIVMQLLHALEYSHTRGVVHRDIKPANIMITKDGQVKVADFGIAKIDSSNLTHAGEVLGTPTYMSPEQIMGSEVDHRTDIYAAGVILFQFLTGERPYSGGLISMMRKIVHEDVVPPSRLNRNVPAQLDAIVMKAMAKQPEDRFQTAAEFRSALEAIEPQLPASMSTSHADDGETDGRERAVPEETLVLPTRLEMDATLSAKSGIARGEEQTLLLRDGQAYVESERGQPADVAGVAPDQAHARKPTDEEKNALFARRLAKIRNEVAKTGAAEESKRKKAAAEQKRRSDELSAFLAEHDRKYAEFVAARAAAQSRPRDEGDEADLVAGDKSEKAKR